LGFDKAIVRINNRKLLDDLLKYAGVKDTADALRAIDKLDKVGVSGVKEELKQRGIPKDAIERIMQFLKISGKPDAVIKQIASIVSSQGLDELKQLVDYLKMMGIESRYVIDPSLARGLEYYTGPVFEVSYGDIGSIAGGGRYDKMIGAFAGKDVPATGISLGIDRIVELRKSQKKSVTDVFIAVIGNTLNDALKIARKMRKKGLNIEIDLLGRGLSKQFEYANSKGIPKVIIVGERDIKDGFVTERDMKTGKQRRFKL
jgi:histidyl-tRNA synthetase